MPQAKIGVIGGSGLYQIEGMSDVEVIKVSTPFGDPSDHITIGAVEGVAMAFLPRHGRGHHINPTELPVRANIWALKSLGVECIISVSAVGSLREDIAPRDLVIPDQLFDRTRSRINSFFEDGIVVHCSFAEPFSSSLSKLLFETASELKDVRVHKGGTYICMEGPFFSTKAESHVYRKLGMDIIGMTALPEAKLAREAELDYAMIACTTDYDCWHETAEAVTVEVVLGNLNANVANAQHILRGVARKVAANSALLTGEYANALAGAIITDPKLISPNIREKYHLLVGKYLA